MKQNAIIISIWIYLGQAYGDCVQKLVVDVNVELKCGGDVASCVSPDVV